VIRGGFSDPAIISHFRADEFSDVDGDGFREFSDAWGKPIRFLRWAPFFVSRYQPAPAEQTQDHDAFDTAGVDPLARCTLFPLIISGGPDGQPNITLRDGDAFSYAAVAYDPYFHDRFNNVNAGRSHLFIQKGTNKLPLAPYAANLSVSYFNARFGEAQSWSDDVHNHSMSR
jgi:hypothetical protein